MFITCRFSDDSITYQMHLTNLVKLCDLYSLDEFELKLILLYSWKNYFAEKLIVHKK